MVSRIKNNLLAGLMASLMALTLAVVGMTGTASAVDVNINGTVNAATALATTNTLINTTDDVAAGVFQYASDDIQATTTYGAASNIDFNTHVFLVDAGGNNAVASFGTLDVATGAELIVALGQTDGDTKGANNHDQEVRFAGNVTGTGTLTVRSGEGTAANLGGLTNKVTIGQGGATTAIGNLKIQGSAADASNQGYKLQVVDLAGGTVTAVTNVEVTGSAGGDSNTNGIGGVLTVTDATALITAGGEIKFTGGAGGALGVGGAVTVADISGGLKAPTITFTGGAGGASATGATGGDGGAVALTTTSNTAWTAADVVTVRFKGGAGADGLANTASNQGGDGGAVGTTDLNQAYTGTNLYIEGGAGGDGGAGNAAVGGIGGAGGAVSGFTSAGQITSNVFINTGTAGAAGAAGAGSASGGASGAGGAVTITDFTTGVAGSITLTTGGGGAAGAGSSTGVGGIGADGGVLTFSDNATMTAGSGGGHFTATSGNGGAGADAVGTSAAGAAGGAGGAMLLSKVSIAAVAGNLTITTGNGAAAGNGVAARQGGVGGAGGAIVVTDTVGHITGNTVYTSGNGATGGSTAGTATGAVGGAGGLLTVSEAGQYEDLTATTGNGGTGGATSAAQTGGDGGAGGGVTLSATNSGAKTATGNVVLTGGTGGTGGASTGSGTAGDGGIGGVLASGAHTGHVDGNITLTGGDGGTGGAATAGTGGAGGAGGTVGFHVVGNIVGNVTLDDGATGNDGSSGGGTGGSGGAAGLTTLTIAAGTVTGDISAAADGEGAVIASSSGTIVFSGEVGTSSKALKSVTSSQATTFAKNMYADAIALSANFTATGTSKQVMSGAVTGTGALILNAAAIVELGSTATLNTINLGANSATKLIVNDTVTLMTDDALTVGANANIELGSGIVAGETAFMMNGSTNDVQVAAALTVKMPENFNSGVITLFEDAGETRTATLNAANITVTGNTLATYAAAKGTGDDIIITATRKTSAAIASALGVTEDSAAALDNAATAGASDAAVATAINTVLAAGGEGAKQLAEQVQGTPAGLSATSGAATASAGAAVVSVGSSRMAALRTGNSYASTFGSGFSAGNLSQNNSMWMKPFASFGDQGERKSIAGYDADTYGLAIGADTRLNAKSIVGLSFSYADTDVDSKGAGNAQTDISSYQATFYTDYTTDKWYVEGLVGYARNEIDTSRSITVNTLTASADYGSNQFMINIGGGMPMEIAKNHFITPNASFQYTLVDNETYTETGAGALNLRVDQDEVNIALGVFGARYHAHNDMGSGTLTPEIRGSLTYDFAGDDGQSTSLANGGGAAFGVTGADVVELGYRAGLGLSYAPNDNGLTVSANYDLNQKTDFVGHSANFSLRYEF